MKGNAYVPFMLRRGDGSTLSLDFTAMGSLDSRFTFTRNSTATFINSSGYVESMGAAASNDPTKARFDYDPTTLTARGLLIEGSSTNELTNNETFGTGWTDSNITRDSTNNTSPRNDATALRVTASSANATIIRSAAIGTSAQRTLSVWLRRVSGTGNIQFTTNNGTAWTTQAITSSWVRYTFTATTEAQRVGFRIVTSSDSIELWGAQLETGSGASSYIPTTTSSVQRASEVMYMDGTNFSAWWPSGQSEYSVYFAGDITRTPATTQFMWLARTGSGGTGTSQARHYVTTTNSIRANNTVNDLTSSLSATVGTRFRSVFAVKSGDSALYVNNGSATASVTAADAGLTTTAAQIVFNPNSDVFQHIAALKFWPTRLPNATLQSLIT
jgi:hypothetical protein